ncbi:MAG: HAD family phosphatase [Bacteroidota bacterium]
MSNVLQNIDNIIFDLGGVILEIDIDIIKKGFMSLGFSDLESSFELFKHNKIFEQFEKGQIEPQVMRNEIRKACPNPFSDKQFDEIWNSVILNYPEENIQLLKELHEKYTTFLLSNTNQIHCDFYTEMLNEKFGIEKLDLLFNKAYYSHTSGMRKPDTEFFKLVLHENSLKPEKTLFIDDSKENIEAAKSLGIKTIHLNDFKLTDAIKLN